MKKAPIIIISALMLLSFSSCENQKDSGQKKTGTEVAEGNNNVVDSVALELEAEIEDSLELRGSEISIPDFVGLVEAYSRNKSVSGSRHLRAIGMEELSVKSDTVAGKAGCVAWVRGAESLAETTGEYALRFKSDMMEENTLALFLNGDRTQKSQLYFTDKRLVPVYVKELVSMGCELVPEKSNENFRCYESKESEPSFEEHFAIVISDEGCAVVMWCEKEEK